MRQVSLRNKTPGKTRRARRKEKTRREAELPAVLVTSLSASAAVAYLCAPVANCELSANLLATSSNWQVSRLNRQPWAPASTTAGSQRGVVASRNPPASLHPRRERARFGSQTLLLGLLAALKREYSEQLGAIGRRTSNRRSSIGLSGFPASSTRHSFAMSIAATGRYSTREAFGPRLGPLSIFITPQLGIRISHRRDAGRSSHEAPFSRGGRPPPTTGKVRPELAMVHVEDQSTSP